MEGGEATHLFGSSFGSYTYGFPNLPSFPSATISRPPLSALDKFLLSQPHQTLSQDLDREIVGGGFGEFSPPFSGSISSSHASGSHHFYPSSSPPPPSSSWLLPVLQDQPNYYYNHGGLFEGGGILAFNQQSNMQQGKRGKSGPPAFLVKGQWTEEEDSALVELVNEHGVRKWAQIAEKLLGRTGKQCRERWQNHLRPDIKKDSWTEDEEKLLVRAHELFGNRWAEIAKKIPGRTENSIKNHWNATKRRQNSKRKSKKIDAKSGKPKSCVLQEYIKRKCLESKANTSEDIDLSDNDESESSPLLDYGCDEEILFMQNFFKDCNIPVVAPQVVTYDEQVCLVPPKQTDNQMTQASDQLQGGSNSCYENPIDLTQEVMDSNPSANENVSGPLSSDLYISQLLEGAGYFGSGSSSPTTNDQYNYYYDEAKEDSVEMDEHQSYQQSKDMDLMEMMYAVTNQQFDLPFSG